MLQENTQQALELLEDLLLVEEVSQLLEDGPYLLEAPQMPEDESP